MRIYVSCCFVFLLASAEIASAQWLPPAMFAQEGDQTVPVALAKMSTAVRIHGRLAETTTTLTFLNKSDRVIEGDLYFPLPDGATITGYALDVNGLMVDGVAVEKHKARQVFEDIARFPIVRDPGLVEWTKGNSFRTRVYPIMAHGVRTVRLQYAHELAGDQRGSNYYLPLKLKAPLDEFSLTVEVLRPEAPPTVNRRDRDELAFVRQENKYVARLNKRHWTPGEDLSIRLPKSRPYEVLVESADDGQCYFAIQDQPTPALATAARPRHIVIYWDASGSRAGDHRREIALLRGWLDRLLTQNKASVELVFFRHKAETPLRWKAAVHSPRELLKALADVQYDGATCLGSIGSADRSPPADLYLLFTDGMSSLGDEMPKFDAPVCVFASGVNVNHLLLRSLANVTGGAYFNLTEQTDAEVLAQAGRASWLFLKSIVDSGEAADIYPRQPQPVAGRFTLVGKLNGDTATVSAQYGTPGNDAEKHTFEIARADAVEGGLLRSLWAEKKLAELLTRPARNEKEIVALGREYHIVTPYTSLMVLERIDQYLMYGICPPKSLPELYHQYQQMGGRSEETALRPANTMNTVLVAWREVVRWWRDDTPRAKPVDQNEARSTKRKGANSPFAPAASSPLVASGRKSNGMGGAGGMGGSMGGSMGGGAGGMGGFGGMGGGAGGIGGMGGGGRGGEGRGGLGIGRTSGTLDPGEPLSIPVQAGAVRVAIQPWDPAAPYLASLRSAKSSDGRLAAYFEQREKHSRAPAFFIDCAEVFREAGDDELALQVLSNLAELNLEEPSLLRVLAAYLAVGKQFDLAVTVLEHVLTLRPEEPQSYRDLALALAERAEHAAGQGRSRELLQQDYLRALNLLNEVVTTRWDTRFNGIDMVAIIEANHLIPRARAVGVTKIPLDARLIKSLDVDLRVVCTWQHDATDVNLLVNEPRDATIVADTRGSSVPLASPNIRGGYGPDQYLVRAALRGDYRVDVVESRTTAQRLFGPTIVKVDIFTNYGREKERHRTLLVRIKQPGETIHVADVKP